jgi:two-component system NtrC family sensor kinase
MDQSLLYQCLLLPIKFGEVEINKPATFYWAWSAFFAGLLFFVLKDLGVLPHNDLTVYTMTIGSAIEGILLSFGLADRINQLKLEKEESDAMRIKAIESQNECWK